MTPRVLLGAVLALAAGLRLWGIDFGLPHSLARPDEDAVFVVSLRFFQRELNPGFFHWPSLFMYVVAAAFVVYFNVGRLLGWFRYESSFISVAPLIPAPLYLIARLISATAGIVTVWTVHGIGRLMWNGPAALLAAFFLATCALHVRDSHFGVTDVAATWLITLAFLYAARHMRNGTRRDALLAAMWTGLAASTKYNAALVALPCAWAVLLAPGDPARSIGTRGRLLATCGGVSALAFAAATPYAILDWPHFITALTEVGDHLRGGHMALAGPGWMVHLGSSLRYGVGLPVLAAALAGFAWALARDWPRGVLLAVFPWSYFVAIGAGETAFARYIVPVLPFLCLAAGYAVAEGASRIAVHARRPAAMPLIAAALAVALTAPSIAAAVRTDRILARSDSRLLAADWIARSFPAGVTVYQTGSIYAHVQMQTAVGEASGIYRPVQLDDTGAFRTSDGARESPQLIVVLESPLGYTNVPQAIPPLLDRAYELRQTIRAVDIADSSLVYDRDDAFFVPLSGFDAVERPGPNVRIYIRRQTP